MRACSAMFCVAAAVAIGCTGPQVPPPTGGLAAAGPEEETFVAPPGRRLAAGVLFGCVVGEDQLLRCWHESDPLAPPDAPRPVPAEVAGLGEVAEVAASGARACALRVDGQVLCWTDEPPDPLAGGEPAPPEPVPDEVGLRESLRVSVGGLGVCAIHRHGEVRCVGLEGIGGEGATPLGNAVVEVPEVAPATDVSVGGSSVCALRAGGQVACWDRGEAPTRVSGVVGAVAISVGDGFACAVDGGGFVLCWGRGATVSSATAKARARRAPCRWPASTKRRRSPSPAGTALLESPARDEAQGRSSAGAGSAQPGRTAPPSP